MELCMKPNPLCHVKTPKGTGVSQMSSSICIDVFCWNSYSEMKSFAETRSFNKTRKDQNDLNKNLHVVAIGLGNISVTSFYVIYIK